MEIWKNVTLEKCNIGKKKIWKNRYLKFMYDKGKQKKERNLK